MMKNKFNPTILFLGIFTLLLLSCEKENLQDIPQNESLFYPDGFTGTAILFNNETIYQVPTGYALYLSSCERLFIDNTDMEYYVTDKNLTEIVKHKILIIPSDTTVHNMGFLNGLLIKNDIEILNWYTDSTYIVPYGKTLYLTSFNEFGLSINHRELQPLDDNLLEVFTPLILPEGTILSHNENHVFTGYLREN